MKRYLIVILIQFVSIYCFSQINRTIWGVTLGQSSKQQVSTMLIRKGYTVKNEDDGSLSIKVQSVDFGGGIWSYVAFDFVGGYLSQITFQNNEYDSPININDTYKKVKSLLDTKYRKYYIGTPPGYIITDISDYSDGKTTIYLAIGNNKGRFVNITYRDDYLDKKRQQNAIDEL